MENNSIILQIGQFIQLTKDKKIIWSSQPNNPFFAKWERTVDGKTITVTIQKMQLSASGTQRNTSGQIVAVGATYYYYLSIVKSNPQPVELLLQLNSQTESQYKDSLTSLFSVASDSAIQSSAELFKSLFEGL